MYIIITIEQHCYWHRFYKKNMCADKKYCTIILSDKKPSDTLYESSTEKIELSPEENGGGKQVCSASICCTHPCLDHQKYLNCAFYVLCLACCPCQEKANNLLSFSLEKICWRNDRSRKESIRGNDSRYLTSYLATHMYRQTSGLITFGVTAMKKDVMKKKYCYWYFCIIFISLVHV